MNSTVVMVMVLMGGFLVVVGVLRTIDWYKVFNKVYGDNPAKARVYIEYGEKIESIEGKLYGVLENSILYEFAWGKDKHMVIVKHDYPYMFIHGHRKIRVLPGQAFAAPIAGVSGKVFQTAPLDEGKSPELGGSRELNVTIRGQTQIDMVKSIKSHKATSIMAIILVVAAVGVGLWFFYNNMIKDSDIIPVQQQQQQPTPTQSIEELIEESK